MEICATVLGNARLSALASTPRRAGAAVVPRSGETENVFLARARPASGGSEHLHRAVRVSAFARAPVSPRSGGRHHPEQFRRAAALRPSAPRRRSPALPLRAPDRAGISTTARRAQEHRLRFLRNPPQPRESPADQHAPPAQPSQPSPPPLPHLQLLATVAQISSATDLLHRYSLLPAQLHLPPAAQVVPGARSAALCRIIEIRPLSSPRPEYSFPRQLHRQRIQSPSSAPAFGRGQRGLLASGAREATRFIECHESRRESRG